VQPCSCSQACTYYGGQKGSYDVEKIESKPEAEVVLVEAAVATAADGSDDGLPAVLNLFDWMDAVRVRR
jgi:hypothetical protein